MGVEEPICFLCDHYIGAWRCEAFPNGIPSDIKLMKHDHTKPYSGDKGILFEPTPPEEEPTPPTEAFKQTGKDFVELCLGLSQCDSCKHYQSEDFCKAFPYGIPLDIMADEFIHDDLHPEQETDILFERRTSKDGN